MCNGVRATWLSTSCKRTGRKLVTTSPGVPRGHFLWTERSPLSDCRETLHGFCANLAFWRKQSKILLQKHLETCTESFIIMEIGKGSVAVATNYSVALERILREFSFETLFLPAEASELYVTSQDVNRPGLLLAGRDDYFDPARIQILGLSEMEFLKTKTQHEQAQALKRLTSRKPAGILITRDLACPEDLLSLCKTYGVPLLRTGESTSSCMSALIYFLGTELAERVTRHGVLVEVCRKRLLRLVCSNLGAYKDDPLAESRSIWFICLKSHFSLSPYTPSMAWIDCPLARVTIAFFQEGVYPLIYPPLPLENFGFPPTFITLHLMHSTPNASFTAAMI